ncbi:hypothetical protein DMUE_1636 [Dictyocoela muelleri]|nr:hypothetical protein DMUE_1636 [Dictyocoela muelleri]
MNDEFKYILEKIKEKPTTFFLNSINEIKGFKIENSFAKNNSKRDNYKKLNIKYEHYKKINIDHKKYINSLLNDIPKINRTAIIHNIELTGAELTINPINDKKLVFGNKGIVVEEKKNVILMIFPDDKLRIIPKNQNEFIFEFDGVNYTFLKNLKKNRHFKYKK